MDKSKRVYGFIDMFDAIPKDAKYLYSKEFNLPVEETEEQKSARIINNTEFDPANNTIPIFKHFYEVELVDFEKLTKHPTFNEDLISKIKRFGETFRIPVNV